MKKLSLLLLSFCTTMVLFAQGDARFGLKAGVNISKTTNDASGGTDALVGYHVGALAHIHLNRDFALQPEVVFSSQGGKYYTSDGEHHLVLNYVNIPLQLQYMFANGFRLQTGPQVGFLVSAKDKRNGNETGYVRENDFKNVDFDWSFGLGYLSPTGLGLDGRYNLGISNINNVNANKIHNNVWQIGLFYLFDHNQRTHATYRHRHR